MMTSIESTGNPVLPDYLADPFCFRHGVEMGQATLVGRGQARPLRFRASPRDLRRGDARGPSGEVAWKGRR